MKNRLTSKSRGAQRRRSRVVVYVFLGAVGVVCAWILMQDILSKNRIAALGLEQRGAEKEIATLEQDISALNLSIEEQLSRKNLTARLIEHRTRLRPIQPGSPIAISFYKDSSASPR